MRDLLGQPLSIGDTVLTVTVDSRGGRFGIGTVKDLTDPPRIEVDLVTQKTVVSRSFFDYNCFRVDPSLKVKRIRSTSKKDITGKPVSVGDWVILVNGYLGAMDLGQINDVYEDGVCSVDSETHDWYNSRLFCKNCFIINDSPALTAYLISR